MEESTQQESASKRVSLEQITYFILGGLALLLPFFIIPSSFVGVGLSKGFLISVGIILALSLFIISIIKKGEIEVPKNLIFLSALIIPVVFLMSALMNGSTQMSLLGYVFEIGTVSSVFFGFLFLFLTSQIFRSKERIFYSYLGFFASFAVIVLYHLIRFLFGPGVLSFGILTSQTGNLIGSWNDLAIFFGAVAILSLSTLEMVVLNKTFKTLISIVFGLSILFLAIVNFTSVWIVLGIFSLVFFLYIISFDHFSPSKNFLNQPSHDEHNQNQEFSNPNPPARKISYIALVVIVVCALFIFAGNTMGAKISDFLGVSNVEVRPAWSTTFDIASASLKENPVLGSGPNTFTNQWLKFKPAEVNESIFWNTDFSYAIGLIPTFATTTGALGILAWLFFLSLIIFVGVRAIFQPISDLFSRYLIASSFLVSMFFWIMSVIYVPSITNFGLAFFFTGLFLASLYREKLLNSTVLSLSRNPKVNFVSVLVLTVMLISTVVLGYSITQKSLSFIYFQKSLSALNVDVDLEKSEANMVRAVEFGGYDIYYRGMSELGLFRINEILNREGATFEGVRDEFQQVLARSIESARQATQINPRNYQNWVSLARVYSELVPEPFAIPGAYENAKSAYEEALRVNPHNPAIYLLMARLEVANGDLNMAKEYANKSVQEKSNYAEGHFLISQIEVEQGNLAQAITSLETTLILSPNNPGLFFQLGILKYNNRDFMGAIDSLARAVEIVPDYANAKYFLGLSLSRIGETALAIQQFEGIETTNPDNEEVKIILENLREGNDPFAGVQPPLDNRPEQRESLPIEE